MSLYKSEAEIEEIVRGFESCETDKDAFSHASHLAVGVWYLLSLPSDLAAEKMRAGLLRFLDHHNVGRQIYHETLTNFWLALIERTISRMDPGSGMLDTANAVVAALSDKNLPLEYYSAERLGSDEARRTWIKPDLKAFRSTG